MKKLLGLAIVLAVAIVLVLTKPTPREIASAAAGRVNYVVVNEDKMPRDFAAAAAAAAIVKSVQEVFSIGGGSPDPGVNWRTRDLAFLMYSDLTLADTGSLKCIWLLHNGFCYYAAR